MPIESIIARKSLGILMHPTCIPGGRLCGTFGKGAKEWIKKLHKHGIEYWQFLPLTPTDSTGSPYSKYDRMVYRSSLVFEPSVSPSLQPYQLLISLVNWPLILQL